MKEDKPYALHILGAIASIKRFCEGRKKSDFLKDEMMREAVIRKLEIIGEASKRLSKDFKGRSPDIRWASIAGLRDKLIHDYAGVDYEIVWGIIEKDLPPLEDALKSSLKK